MVTTDIVWEFRPFDELPPELLSVIFFFVPCTKTLGTLMRVCRRFYECLRKEQNLWMKLCLQFWQNKDFHLKVDLFKILQEFFKFQGQVDWLWIASCFSHENLDCGLSWKRFNTTNARSLVSIGEMSQHRLNNVGIEIYLDGTTYYMGRFNDGKLHGKGSIFWEGGAKYEGDWKDGHREGFGSYTWVNGDRYVGEFKNDGKKEGKGIFFYADGDRFEGSYRNDERDGWGKMIWKGSQFAFEGKFVNNEPEDPVGSLHPSLREMITQQVCTGVVTGRSLDFGQFFYECECADYCSVCWTSCPHTKHSNGESYRWVRKWSDGTYCACVDKESCVKRRLAKLEGDPPAKRQRTSQ
jgi:hypothetical protein